VGIAFFDLDGTILPLNSGPLWVRRELALGHISRMQAARAGLWLGAYKLGLVNLEAAVVAAIAFLEGTAEKALRQRTTDFFRESIRSRYRPGALAALERHRGDRDHLVLLTSSSLYLSELVAEELKFDAILCNRFEVDDQGVHTGRAVGKVCFGAGKLHHAQSYAEEAKVDLSDAVFYTDSYSDVPVLEKVGKPVVVNPDVRLWRHAARRGWPVVDWGGPAASNGRD
jgi:HAD superfamily hydrolase (TIGR01490 family)